ncbi:MCE family protein [Nocardia seriolae]|uniref:Mce family protein n=2 Tax=Nocardia seriolae TaxID=37332 RepID=A0A0B8N6P6_9NOCA|nr:MCE family protein [Nocardia seriolae]GEM25137.1 mammalian cell entry protein [Nocardia seriolae NBRC 15557]MTJ66983.1 MCE family protein [Nocardia seriolae]MTJ72808.1 MCE family protein [Nocardia seriolae]MTJ84964.1 MCE family protein [Nocardia seriolae]MTK28960.1 MCE family protein [Nocardia seriolae]
MLIDPSGRGPTMRQLLIAGVCGLTVIAVVLGFLFARYRGYFVEKVNVTANLTTTGDGLPANADVKFRGVLVGAVKDVSVAAKGTKQEVHIEMKPEYTDGIPANVTARVVPSNLFAVTSVELVYPENGADSTHLKEGSQIAEDTSKGTIALQDTLTKVRDILGKIDPVPFGRVLGTLSYALDGSGRMPGSSIERIDRWLEQVRGSVPDVGGFLDDLSSSMHALNQSAPELMGVLKDSVETAKTISDRRAELTALLAGTSSTIDKVNGLFARNPNVGKDVTTGTSTLFGALSDNPDAIPLSIANLNDSVRKLSGAFGWGPQQQMKWNVGITFTPYKPYTRDDCPRYGELAAPSCGTAPLTSDPGTLPESMRPRAIDAAKDLPLMGTPPPGFPLIPGVTVIGTPEGAPKADTQQPGTDPLAGTPLQGMFPNLQLPAAPASQPNSAPAGKDSAPTGKDIAFTGDDAITALLGRRPTAAEYLLLSPILKGATVQLSQSGGGR